MSKRQSADTERVTASARPTRLCRSPRVSRLVLGATCLAVFGSILAVPTAAWAVPIPWRNCGTAGQAISVQRFDASVWPPQSGQPLTLNFTWSLSETLTKDSREQLTTTWPSGRGAVRWLHFQSPLAVLFDDAVFGHKAAFPLIRLPIPPGPYSQSLTLIVPKDASARQPIGVDLTGFDGTGRQVVCMQMVVPVK